MTSIVVVIFACRAGLRYVTLADHQADIQPRRPRGDRGEDRVPFEHPLGLLPDPGDLVEVVHDEQRVETRRLGRRRDLDELLEQRLRANAGEVEARDLQADANGRTHAPNRICGRSACAPG